VEWERDRRRNSPEGVSRGGARLGLAGVGRKWPSGHEIERGLALEHAHGTRNALAPMWVTGYDISCKRKRGPGCSSPSTGLDGGVTQRRRRRAPAAGRGRSFAVRALQGSSERLDPSGWLAVLLRRGYGG